MSIRFHAQRTDGWLAASVQWRAHWLEVGIWRGEWVKFNGQRFSFRTNKRQ